MEGFQRELFRRWGVPQSAKFFRGRRRERSCRTSANRSVDGPMRFIASSHGSEFEQATND